MLDEVEEPRLGPVDVVEDEDERLSLRKRLDERADCGEAFLRRTGELRQPDRRGDPDSERLRLARAGEGGCELLPRHVRRVAVVEPDELLDRLEERPERDPLAVGQATATRDPCPPRHSVQELLHEPRLADTGEPEDGEELARGVCASLLEGVRQPTPLAAATHHRRVQPPRRRREPVADAQQPPGVACAIDCDCIAHELPDSGIEQHLAGGGRPSQRGRAAERRPAGAQRTAGVRARDDLAGADPQAHVELGHALARKLLRKLREGGTSVDGRPNRPERVVLVRRRQPEDGSDGFARHRLDDAAVAFDRVVDLAERPTGKAQEGLRIERLAFAGGDGNLCGDDGHRLPNVPRLDRRRARRLGPRRLGPRRLGLRGGRGWPVAVEGRVLPEDGLMKVAERAAGLDPELAHERSPSVLVDLERLSLTPGPVEREHELTA